MNKEKILKAIVKILSIPIVVIGYLILGLGYWIIRKFDPNEDLAKYFVKERRGNE